MNEKEKQVLLELIGEGREFYNKTLNRIKWVGDFLDRWYPE